MLYTTSISTATLEEFEAAIAEAERLCLETDEPIRVSGHCSPLDSGGNGSAGIMFGVLSHHANGSLNQILYSVHTSFPLDHAVFEMSYALEGRLRASGKLIGYSEWEEDRVTHIITIPWNKYDWEYGMIATDREAVLCLFELEGTRLKRGKLKV